MTRRFPIARAILIATATLSSPAQAQRPAPSAPRAILVSFDGFSEQWMRKYSDRTIAPNVWAMFDTGVCAESVRPAFPSVTPTSHASIWTGAYSNINGVSAAANGVGPWPQTTILDVIDGYKPAALAAEPIWITAARQGKVVFSHMATQSPQAPAYTPRIASTPALDSARASAARTILQPNITAFNIYNELVEPAHVFHSAAHLDWAVGKEGDSLHARVVDDRTVEVRLNRDGRRRIRVRLAATDTTLPIGRPLARFFSAPLRIDLAHDRRTFVFFRLFELSRDRSSLLLYASEARVIQANRPGVARSYDNAVQGLIGNGAGTEMDRDELGPRVPNGGDGSAEYRYLETAELLTRQFMKGFAWGWTRRRADLATDYLPYPDEILHRFLAYAEPGPPNVSDATRRNAVAMLRRGYLLMDRDLAQLRRFASATPGTLLFVTGEHGMRPAWMSFRPNMLLKRAGLLVTDSADRVDLSRTKAMVTGGYFVIVNRAMRKGGIVPDDSVDAVLARVETTLRAARDSAGMPVVTRIFRSGTAEGDSLGLGGTGGGDLYYDLAPGFYWSASRTGDPISPMPLPKGEHGFPSIDRDMHPALCITGGGPAHRIGEVRSIDIAPTIAAWLRITPPREATGKSLLPQLH